MCISDGKMPYTLVIVRIGASVRMSVWAKAAVFRGGLTILFREEKGWKGLRGGGFDYPMYVRACVCMCV